MIRNIIYDLGNVLISFRPEEYLIKNNYPESLRKIILKDIFGGPEWLLLDNGNISRDTAIDLISEKSALKKDEITLIFKKRTEIMFPLDRNVKVLPELKKQGFKLYYLSNFPSDIFDEIKSRFSFFNYFDGGIISAEVNHSKPDPEIFRILIDRYDIRPAESLYLDDIEINIRAAELSGFYVFHTGGSEDFTEKLKLELKKLLPDNK